MADPELTSSRALGPRHPKAGRAPAASRTASILGHLAQSPNPLTLSQIASALDLIPSTCLNILRDLIGTGLVRQVPNTKQYALGLAVLPLAHRYVRQSRLAQASQSELNRLKAKYGLAFLVTKRDERNVAICLASAVGEFAPRTTYLGLSENAFAGAAGQVLLSVDKPSKSELSRIFQSLPWSNAPSFARWHRDIVLAGERGFGIDENRYRNNRTFVAVPIIVDEHGPIGTLSVAGWSEQFENLEIDQIVKDAKLAMRNISSAL